MNPKIISTFPERLRQCLENNSSISATILAEQIGLSKQAISMYLSGSRKPKRPTVKVIADALNVNEAWLIGYDVPMEKISDNIKSHPILLHQIEQEYGKNAATALKLYVQLDEIDQSKIIERMETLLEDEKYSSDSVLLAARGGKIKLDKKAAEALAKSANEAPNSSQDKDMF